MACPDATTIQAALAGVLVPAERAAIDTHVDTCRDCRRVFAALVATATSEPPAAARPGTTIGRYRIHDQLGVGGMGVVYAAHDPELHRDVAVKLLRFDGEGDDNTARLQREAQAMAQIAHPNVITVHDVGEWRGQVFVAMELAPGGQTLRQWQRDRAWPDVVDAYVQAGRGLAAAHAAGLVHRDFKPDNVLIGGDGRPRVTDFGLARTHELPRGARPLAPPSPLELPLTTTGLAMGTPGYMAPEQHRGAPVDARTDQFAFCVALWEAVFGARPFDGDDEDARAIRRPRGVRIPAAIERALRRGLSADPDHRWPAMDALLGALVRAPRRRPRPAIAIVAGVVAVAAIVTVALGGDPPVDPREIEVRSAILRAQDVAIRGNSDEARRLASDAVTRARAIGSPALIAESLITQARVHALVRDLPSAEAMLVEAVQRAETAGNDAIKVTAIGQLVTVLDDEGKHEDARRWRGMLPATAAHAGTDDDSRATALEDEARSLYADGKLADALERADRAGVLRQRIGEPSALFSNRAFVVQVLTGQGKLDRARAVLRELAATMKARPAGELGVDASLAGAASMLAGVELARRDWPAAEAAARDAVARLEALGWGSSAAASGAWAALGTATGQRGDETAATAAFARAIAALGDDRVAIAGIHALIAGVATERGDRAIAIREITTALEIHKDAPGADRRTTAFYQAQLGELLVDDGRDSEARAVLEPALAGLDPNGRDAVMVARARFALARALELDQRARARELAAQARDTLRAAGELQVERSAAVEAWFAAQR